MVQYKTLVKKVSISPEKKTKQKDYLPKGQLPIIDQGQQLIGGYSDNPDLQLSCNLPVIVFGDHTRAVKYVDFPFGAGADGIKVLEPAKGIYPKFLYYATQYLVFRLEDRGYARHYQYIEKKELDIPSISEQKRIVAYIEELFSELDNGVETLRKTKQQLAVYRQTVMVYAFSGKLTKEWRKANPYKKPDYFSVSHNIRDQLAAKSHAKKLKYAFPEKLALYDIPEEWDFIQMGDIAWSIKDGPHFSPQYSETGIPFITGGNVRPNGVDFISAKRISPELHEEFKKRCFPEKGDMLYTKGGTTGIARVNTYDFPFSVWVHVAVIKYANTVIPEYFQHVLNSPFCYRQSQDYTHGVGNQDLGLTRMINIVFPICSIDEQQQVVRELETRLSVCDSIEQTVDTALQQAEAMRQSVLKRAFEGRI